MYKQLLFTIMFLLVLGVSGCASIVEKKIKLTLDSGEQILALYAYPKQKGTYPAVIFNHGTGVRKLGHGHQSQKGYPKKYVDTLAKNGFVAIAPIRQTGRLRVSSGQRVSRKKVMCGPPEQWDAAIKEGIAANRMALAYLKKQPIVQADRIGIMGLSEGGLVAMWTLFGLADFKAAVLISPANISRSPRYWFKIAYLNVDTIRSPVFLAVGQNDIPVIKLNCRLLIPKMKDLNNPFEYKYYPGDHEWFKTIRAELWEDIIGFLKANLTKSMGPHMRK